MLIEKKIITGKPEIKNKGRCQGKKKRKNTEAARLALTVTKSWKVGQTVQQKGSQGEGQKQNAPCRHTGAVRRRAPYSTHLNPI